MESSELSQLHLPEGPTQTEEMYHTLSRVLSIQTCQQTGEVRFEMNCPLLANLVINRAAEPAGYTQEIYAPDFNYRFTVGLDFFRGNSEARMQTRSYFEFIYVLEGRLVEQIDERENCYTPGTCRLLTHNTRYTMRHDTDYKAIIISVTNNLIQRIRAYEDLCFFQDEAQACAPLLCGFLGLDLERQKSAARDYIIFSPVPPQGRHTREMEELFGHITRILSGGPQYGSTFLIQGLFCRFLSMLTDSTRYRMEHVHLQRGSDAVLFSRITSLLYEADGKLTRAQLEGMLNYDGSYIGRVVKKYSGLPLYDYSMTFCMAKAALLLRGTELPVTDIIHQLGITNKTHFYKHFKRIYQMTPREYRMI